MKKTIIIPSIILLAFIAWIAIGYFSSQVEQLQYTVLENDKEYEIRETKKHLIAQTTITGNFQNSQNNSFNILAGYIFGKNKTKESIAMTTPVIEKESEKIAMTAPVIEKESNSKERIYSFVLPSKYTLETLPEPLDSRVKIKEVEPEKIAVLRFSGFYSEKKIQAKKEELKKYLERDGIEYSTLSWAGYNPPWTPPFMRRIEVWALIK